jgi:spore germination protein GerM
MNVQRTCGLLALVILIPAAGCGFPAQHDAAPISDEALPVGLRSDTTSEAELSQRSQRATIWLVDGDRLVSARHEVAAPASAASVTDALLAAPNDSEQRRGLRSALPDPGVAVGAASSRGVATVELNDSFAEIAPEDQILAVGQFVLTLTDAPGVGSVTFEIAGEPVAVPLPTGESTELPVFREQYLELTAR